MMQHLFASRVRVRRRTITQTGGVVSYSYTVVPGMERVKCRLDLQYVRPGKDVAPPMEAGKAPDRFGVGFFLKDSGIKAGDRLETVDNDFGEQPVEGMFEIRTIPEAVVGSVSRHHIEVQVWETQQALDDLWPTDTAI